MKLKESKRNVGKVRWIEIEKEKFSVCVGGGGVKRANETGETDTDTDRQTNRKRERLRDTARERQISRERVGEGGRRVKKLEQTQYHGKKDKRRENLLLYFALSTTCFVTTTISNIFNSFSRLRLVRGT